MTVKKLKDKKTYSCTVAAANALYVGAPSPAKKFKGQGWEGLMMNRKEHEKNAGQRSVLTRVRDRFSVRNLKRVLAGTVALLMAVLVAGMATPAQADEPVSTFTSTWNTTRTSTGSSTATQISLPLVSTGEYDFTVDWERHHDAGQTSQRGTHRWRRTPTRNQATDDWITGLIKGFSFDNAGDRLKLTDISDWGLGWETMVATSPVRST